MGRAGGGSSHVSHSSGGSHHSSSHSGGGHYVSSGHSRAGASSSSSSRSSNTFIGGINIGGGYGGGYSRMFRHPSSSYGYGRSYGYGGGAVSGVARAMQTIQSVVVTIVIVVIALIFIMSLVKGKEPQSTIERTKIANPSAFDNNCVDDELGWINNPGKLARNLQDFYKETGVQPYIVLLEYNADLSTDSDKQDYAYQYFEATHMESNAFAYFYFAEPNADDDVGFMCYEAGADALTVMDAEAVDIFWSYLDADWYSWDADDTDGMFVDIFNKTSKAIMHVSKSNTAWKWIACIVLVVGCVIVVIITSAIKKKQLKVKETEAAAQVLNATLDKAPDAPDSLENKYL